MGEPAKNFFKICKFVFGILIFSVALLRGTFSFLIRQTIIIMSQKNEF